MLPPLFQECQKCIFDFSKNEFVHFLHFSRNAKHILSVFPKMNPQFCFSLFKMKVCTCTVACCHNCSMWGIETFIESAVPSKTIAAAMLFACSLVFLCNNGFPMFSFCQLLKQPSAIENFVKKWGDHHGKSSQFQKCHSNFPNDMKMPWNENESTALCLNEWLAEICLKNSLAIKKAEKSHHHNCMLNWIAVGIQLDKNAAFLRFTMTAKKQVRDKAQKFGNLTHLIAKQLKIQIGTKSTPWHKLCAKTNGFWAELHESTNCIQVGSVLGKPDTKCKALNWQSPWKQFEHFCFSASLVAFAFSFSNLTEHNWLSSMANFSSDERAWQAEKWTKMGFAFEWIKILLHGKLSCNSFNHGLPTNTCRKLFAHFQSEFSTSFHSAKVQLKWSLKFLFAAAFAMKLWFASFSKVFLAKNELWQHASFVQQSGKFAQLVMACHESNIAFDSNHLKSGVFCDCSWSTKACTQQHNFCKGVITWHLETFAVHCSKWVLVFWLTGSAVVEHMATALGSVQKLHAQSVGFALLFPKWLDCVSCQTFTTFTIWSVVVANGGRSFSVETEIFPGLRQAGHAKWQFVGHDNNLRNNNSCWLNPQEVPRSEFHHHLQQSARRVFLTPPLCLFVCFLGHSEGWFPFCRRKKRRWCQVKKSPKQSGIALLTDLTWVRWDISLCQIIRMTHYTADGSKKKRELFGSSSSHIFSLSFSRVRIALS